MKHLKLFEDINIEGFEEISNKNDEFFQSKKEVFTKTQYDYLINIGFSNDYLREDGVLRLIDSRYMVDVYKYTDDWYMVCVFHRKEGYNGHPKTFSLGGVSHYSHYRCDQWDGLLNCLKTIGVI